MKDVIVVTSGFFNPIHRGHLALLREAKKLGTQLWVIVNNDEQVKVKGSKKFMDSNERMAIVGAIRYVDRVILCEDLDGTVNKSLRALAPDIHIFAKCGDSVLENTPEVALCHELGVEVVFNVGGEKVQSSRWLKDSS